MSVATLRAQFGLQPAGDPYGNPALVGGPSWLQGGVYSTVASRNLPNFQISGIFSAIGQAITLAAKYAVLRNAPFMMQNRYIAYYTDTKFTLSTSSSGSVGPLNINTQGYLGPSPLAVGGAVAAAAGPVGAAIGGAASLISSIICTNATLFTQKLQQATTEISGAMSALMTALDQLVGNGQLTVAQASAAWDQYASQATNALASISGSGGCGAAPINADIFATYIKSVGDFNKNIFWPDLYPKAQVAAPAQPIAPTPTPAPANEFAFSPALPPASFVPAGAAPSQPSTVQSLGKPGSPFISAVTVPRVAAPPQVTTGGIFAPLIIVGGIVILILLL